MGKSVCSECVRGAVGRSGEKAYRVDTNLYKNYHCPVPTMARKRHWRQNANFIRTETLTATNTKP